MDYLFRDDIFFGNIGLTCIDKAEINGRHLFEFYITKAYDEEDRGFFKKVVLGKKYLIDEVVENIYKIFNECLVIFDSIKKHEILDVIKLRR